jgi:hypothetical protein
MVTRAYLAGTRACYALVVVIATIAAGYWGFQALGGLGDLSLTFFFLFSAGAFLYLGGGAAIRKLRGRPLISPPANQREWLRLLAMNMLGAFGHFLVFNVCLALYQYRYVYPDRDVEGGPLGFFMMIAAACYLVCLLTGELGLEHPTRAAQPRINPSSGRALPLSGKTLPSKAADDTPR